MSAYSSLTQLLFQGAGGFAIAHLLVPRSFFDAKVAAQVAAQAQQEERPLEQNVRKIYSALQSYGAAPPAYRTLPQDISVLSEQYRVAWTAAVSFIVFCGGAMAIIGAGTAIAFMGDDGTRRYVKMKTWLDKNKIGSMSNLK